MIYGEQGWFPQSDTLYFDFSGCNSRASIKNKDYSLNKSDQTIDDMENKLSDFGSSIGLKAVAPIGSIKPDLNLPILLPLQDERDTNILLDSPFKRMESFVEHILDLFPFNKILVRPHPHYTDVKLPNSDRIVILDTKESFSSQSSRCGLVIGINSTTLLESLLLGLPVVSFGKSLGSGCNVYYEADLYTTSEDIETYSPKRKSIVATLFKLVFHAQLKRDKLSDPAYIMNTSFFQEMCRLHNRHKLMSSI